MRIEKCGLRLLVLVLSAAFMVSSSIGALAQSELPQQPFQGQPPVYTRPTPAPTPLEHPRSGSAVQTLPQVPTNSPSLTNQPPFYQSQPPPQVYRSQPVLPAVFRGCWVGRVEDVDSLNRLPGGAKLGFWTAKTYRLCYRRMGDGPFVLTLSEAGIEQNDRIINPEGRMTLLSSDGRHYASMRSDLDFDEYATRASYSGNSTFAVHEVTRLDCKIEPDGMHVQGEVTGWRDEDPWFRAQWHTIFTHQGEPPQRVEIRPGGIPE